MEPSRRVRDLASQFCDQRQVGSSPSILDYLARVSDDEEKLDLLVQLLVAEFDGGPLNASQLYDRVREFPALSSREDKVITLLQLFYSDSTVAREPVEWGMFCQFGYSPDKLLLRYEDERNYLGEQINGRYRLECRIGDGAYGVVFRAHDLVSGQTVAIKTNTEPGPDSLAMAMLRREAEIGADLSHQRIVHVRDFISDSAGVGYLIMDYIPGGSLTRLVENAPIPPNRAGRIMRGVCEALAYAHSKEIFHRDLKPANILLDSHDNSYVTDFGLALPMHEQWNKEGEVAGTFAYTAPEILFGETHRIDRRSDIWSLGMILYELLTKRRLCPSNDRNEALVTALIGSQYELPFPGDTPVRWRAICHRCLERDPNQRFETAEGMAEAITDALGSIS